MATATAPTERLGPAVTWEEPDCPLCGHGRRTTVLEAPDPHGQHLWFAVARCEECGLQYTCPRPDQASIGQFYPADYRPHRVKLRSRPATFAPLAWLRGRPCIERRTLPWHGQGRLLDFGCGGGSFLERMRDQGWRVTGLDSSAGAVESVRRNIGVPALLGTLPHADLQPQSFDVITMWHSLEHVHEPLDILRAARQLLAPGGQLIVAVPNIRSLPFRWFGMSWFGLDLPRHLTHFTPDTLRAMLAAARFRDIQLRMIRHSDWLRSSAKLACTRLATRRRRWLTRKPVARFTAWLCYVLRQSDCMLATARV